MECLWPQCMWSTSCLGSRLDTLEKSRILSLKSAPGPVYCRHLGQPGRPATWEQEGKHLVDRFSDMRFAVWPVDILQGWSTGNTEGLGPGLSFSELWAVYSVDILAKGVDWIHWISGD